MGGWVDGWEGPPHCVGRGRGYSLSPPPSPAGAAALSAAVAFTTLGGRQSSAPASLLGAASLQLLYLGDPASLLPGLPGLGASFPRGCI